MKYAAIIQYSTGPDYESHPVVYTIADGNKEDVKAFADDARAYYGVNIRIAKIVPLVHIERDGEAFGPSDADDEDSVGMIPPKL